MDDIQKILEGCDYVPHGHGCRGVVGWLYRAQTALNPRGV